MADAVTAVTAPPRRRTVRELQGFGQLAADALNASDPAWLGKLRRRGAERFAEEGLPSARDEEWRFTPLAGLGSVAFTGAGSRTALTADDIAPFLIGDPGWPRLVVVDGMVDPSLSVMAPAGVTFLPLSAAWTTDPGVERHLGEHAGVEATPFTAASAALVQDGAWIEVAEDAVIDVPLHVLHIATDRSREGIVAPRIVLAAGKRSSVTVIESYASITSAPSLSIPCVDVSLAEEARVEHVRVQREGPGTWHVGFTGVTQARRSHYRSFTLALGARLSRHNLETHLVEPEVESLLYGLYLGRGEQLVDQHTAIFHDQPRCRSWEVYKGMLTDRAHGVFNGKVLVHSEAQQTDAKQTNRNLLLSRDAKIDTKPQLEIFADDVKCTHGATVGRLDPQQRYYLQTRGIAGRNAEVLLMTAFVTEVLAEVMHPGIRAALESMVHRAMDAMIG